MSSQSDEFYPHQHQVMVCDPKAYAYWNELPTIPSGMARELHEFFIWYYVAGYSCKNGFSDFPEQPPGLQKLTKLLSPLCKTEIDILMVHAFQKGIDEKELIQAGDVPVS